MPIYVYKCPCGGRSEKLLPMTQYQDMQYCEICGQPMFRDLPAEHMNTPLQAFHTPIEMYSVAPETPGQAADLRRKLPDVKFNDLGVPVAHNRQEKLAILRATGFQEGS